MGFGRIFGRLPWDSFWDTSGHFPPIPSTPVPIPSPPLSLISLVSHIGISHSHIKWDSLFVSTNNKYNAYYFLLANTIELVTEPVR